MRKCNVQSKKKNFFSIFVYECFSENSDFSFIGKWHDVRFERCLATIHFHEKIISPFTSKLPEVSENTDVLQMVTTMKRHATLQEVLIIPQVDFHNFFPKNSKTFLYTSFLKKYEMNPGYHWKDELSAMTKATKI